MRTKCLLSILVVFLISFNQTPAAEKELSSAVPPDEISIQLVSASEISNTVEEEGLVEGVEVLITERQTTNQKKLPDFRARTSRLGNVVIPLKEEGKNTTFLLTLKKNGLYIPQLRYTGGDLSYQINIPYFKITKIKGSLRLDGDYSNIDMTKTRVRVTHSMNFKLRPFEIIADIDSNRVEKDGSWEAQIPQDTQVNLTLSGADIETRYFFLGQSDKTENHVPVDRIHDHDWDIMTRPITRVVGRVTDQDGTPVQGVLFDSKPAKFRHLNHPVEYSEFPSFKSDKNGYFEVSYPFDGGFTTFAQHGNTHFSSRSFESNNQFNKWEISFGQTRSLILKATETGGGVPVGVEYSAIYFGNSKALFNEPMIADEQGVFKYQSAPITALTIEAKAQSRKIAVSRSVPASLPSGSSIDFLFKKPFGMELEVVDAINLHPIIDPKIYIGGVWQLGHKEIDELHWERFTKEDFDQGQLKYQSARPIRESRIFVYADGYRAHDMGLHPGHGTLKQKIALHKGPGLHGVVLDASGKAVDGCQVFIEGIGNQYISAGPRLTHRNSELTLTDQNGRFELPAILSKCYVVALSENGFCRVHWNEKIDEPVKLVLRPFVSMRGTFKKSDGSPWPNQYIKIDTASKNDTPYKFMTERGAFVVKTDGNGDFEFDGLPPMDLFAKHVKWSGIRDYYTEGQNHRVPFDDFNSQHVVIGNKGFKVRGRLSLTAEEVAQLDLEKSYVTIQELTPPPPDRIKDNPRLRSKWYGSAKNKKLTRNRAIHLGEVRKDGTIVFENVSPGQYRLNTRLQTIKGRATYSQFFVTQNVEIKPGIPQTTSKSSPVIDIGELK